MNDYLEVARQVYAAAARDPDANLCSGSSGGALLPGLEVPPIMQEMNYGCGSTVDPADLRGEGPVLYIGVGGGLEALQLAYFRRRPGGVIAIDPVKEMRERARENLAEAARRNAWFRPEFVRILDGAAARLPVPDGSVDLVAQNCLFNILMEDDLRGALLEVGRVLRPGGRYSASDPVAERPLPPGLRGNHLLRARCISGCLTLKEYLDSIAGAGFGRISLRARRPYRLLFPDEYPELKMPLLLESVELVAEKVAAGPRGPAILSGRQAIYRGSGSSFGLRDGRVCSRGIPVPVSDREAEELEGREDFLVTGPTYRPAGATGGGCS
jgi:SAM-dependent methyltransferase